MNPVSYVLPIRSDSPDEGAALAGYFRRLTQWTDEIIVVDGSDAEIFGANASAWSGLVHHLQPDPVIRCLNGKVRGTITGVRAARNDRVVIADDDVRYDGESLRQATGLLTENDLVLPQNYFDPAPWHALWDTGRTLINRAFGMDFPGTMGLRRHVLMSAGGYDGNVLFENLELIRTVEAVGGRVAFPLDLFVTRRPPSARRFWSQRIRQAYDDFALPLRMGFFLFLLPALAVAAVAGFGWWTPAAAILTSWIVAETGRRRCAGAKHFPIAATLFSPLWVMERSVCAWIAVGYRFFLGGCPYAGKMFRRAASSKRSLRRRLTPVSPASVVLP